MTTRPASDEFAPYYGNYIGQVPDGDVLNFMRRNLLETVAVLSAVPEAKAEKGYGAGKWSLKEVICHLSDAERVFSYRLLRIARGDQTPLPGFEQDDWVPASRANERTVASLLLELVAVRSATLQLADSLDEGAWMRRGTASGKEISARALLYICAGHEIHHMKIIRERYLA